MLRLFRFVPAGMLGLLCFLLLNSCAFARDRVYGGKVIDFETREPIEGAVVVAYWWERMATPAGGDSRLKEVKETLTDKDGRWSIVGEIHEKNPDFEMSFLTQTYYTMHPRFVIFKPGYCSWPDGFYIDACRGKMKPGGAGKIAEGESVELPRLEAREDKLRNLPSRIGTHDKERYREFLDKQKEFIILLNQARKSLGLQEH